MNVVLDASEAQATTFLQHLYCLPITTDKTEPVIQGREAFLRGRSTGLTAYDADYLNLALRQGAALATFDRQLASVARQAGVQLVELGDCSSGRKICGYLA